MIIVTGTFRVPPDRIEDARKAMTDVVAITRTEQGCITYQFCCDIADPAACRVYEEWESQEALEAHLDTRHIRAYRAEMAAIGVGDRDIRIVDVRSIRPV